MGYQIELGDRTALVTGGGHGVGKAVCQILAAAGATVVVNDYHLDRAQCVKDEICASGGQAIASQFDVSDFESVCHSFESLPPVDILVNNAGNAGAQAEGPAIMVGEFAKSDRADWERFFGVNLYGVMNCTRAALPNMIDKGHGRVITVISDASRVGEAKMAPYAAAKAGAAGFMRAIAREVGPQGVTANCVSLGAVDTMGLVDAAENDPDMAKFIQGVVKRYSIRRMGQPEDVAGMIAFLASAGASWITGQTYPVNGGYSVSL